MSKSTEIKVTAVHDAAAYVVGSFFNGLQIAPATEFELFEHKKRRHHVVHGESATLAYDGEGEGDEYAVCVYDPQTRSAELFRAPMVQGRVLAKSKRRATGPAIRQAGVRNFEQRTALGEAFGTKKAKSAIANVERNRIDADGLHDHQTDIVDAVAQTTEALPTRQQMEDRLVSERPTPPAHADATNVEEVYVVSEMIPAKEWSFLRVQPVVEAANAAERLALMPWKSAYVASRLERVVASGSTARLQLLCYVSLLFGVYENRRVRDKQSLQEKLGHRVAEALIDGVLERFAVARASHVGRSKDRAFVIDPHHEDKLLCYLLAMVMHLEGFAVELPPLANELNMKPTRLVGLFKALGATVSAATVAQAEAFGIPRAQAGTYKVATLKVPFKLPQMTRGKRR
ncbi:DNA-directed RNA polymerase I subunit RPA49 [[Candida] zeylanoides]